MRKRKSIIICSVLSALIAAAVFLMSACTIVYYDNDTGTGKDEKSYFENSMDIISLVEEIWEDKIIPYCTENAHSVQTVFEAISKDKKAALEEYGILKSAGLSDYYIIVSGTVQVVSSELNTNANYLEVDAAPYDGKSDFRIQLGSVMKGTSIRDVLSFVKVSDFKNQVEYANLSGAINSKVYDDVISSMSFQDINGKTMDITGVILFSGDTALMTPVYLRTVE
jgi:predicted lipoprotein